MKYIVTYENDYENAVPCPDGDALCKKEHVVYLRKTGKRIFSDSDEADRFIQGL